MTKPKIKIIQYMHGTHEYFPWSEWINRRYCERHGYDYVVRRDEPRSDRHVVWHKVPVILDELRDCDYLLFLDADAVFYSHELTVEHELFPALQETSILMAQDCGSESQRWHPGLPNSGVILMKNEERAKEFLYEWNTIPEKDEENRWKWPPTQKALWRHILPKFEDNLHTIPDYYTVQGRYGQFIRHFCRCSGKERTNAMKAIYDRLSTSHHESPTGTKPVIKIVQYHWGTHPSYSITQRINEAYCRRHGYEYVLKTFMPRHDRSPHWAKIPAMREELHDCDFLLFLDADAFFYSQELKVDEELFPFLGTKHVMISADTVSEKYRPHPDKPNTGVILLRNTPISAEFLRVWDESSERPGLEEFRLKPFHEQETCFRTVWQEFAKDVVLLKEYYLMNSHCGIYIRHLMGMKEEERLRHLKMFLEHYREMIPGCEDLDVVVSAPSMKTWKWGIGMVTATHPTSGMLARTLESYRGSGFAPPLVFTDTSRSGELWNLHRAMKTLLEKYPDADAYMLIEDDVLFSKNIREYLESALWPSVEDHGCICSIFTPACCSSEKRWHAEGRGNRKWISQCQIYHPLSAKKLAADIEEDAHLRNKERSMDAVMEEWAAANGIKIWFHCPSLTQHMTFKNTSFEVNRPIDDRISMARDFIGENRSIHEYWAEFGKEPHPIQTLPRLEIFAKGICPDKDSMFTPEMARNLADKLRQYNCGIGEISFAGDDLPSWQYAEECAALLRMTGKIKTMRITLPPTAEDNLKQYELLFDTIEIANDSTHFIEQHAERPFDPFPAKNRAAAGYSQVPRLIGNEVVLYPAIVRQTIEGNTAPEILLDRRWTLDEFFKNIKTILEECGNSCESCQTLP